MPSKIVIDHQKSTEQVREALSTHGSAIAAAVLAVTGAESKKHAVDVAPLVAHAQRETARRLAALIAADDAHQRELGDDAEPRDHRDAAAADLYRALVDLKQATANLFGASWVRKLSFPPELSTDPAIVARTGEQVLGALRTTTLPKPQLPGIASVQSAAWIELLQKPLTQLTASRSAVTREQQESRATLTARDQARADLVAANVAAAQLTLALARVGGVQHLVEGLRGTIDTTSSPLDAEPEPAPTPA